MTFSFKHGLDGETCKSKECVVSVWSHRCLPPYSYLSNPRTFLCFQVGPTHYIVLFGLTTALRAFSKVVKQIRKWAITSHFLLFQYLSDRLNAHADRNTNPQDGRTASSVSSGKIVDKSRQVRVPSQSILFLGKRLIYSQARPSQQHPWRARQSHPSRS